jgi:hypothetical protein
VRSITPLNGDPSKRLPDPQPGKQPRVFAAEEVAPIVVPSPAPLAQPEPEGVTNEDLLGLACKANLVYSMSDGSGFGTCYTEETDIQVEVLDYARAAIAADRARYARPTIQPVPVSERLPGPEELATLVPLMHSGASLCHSEGFYEESDAIGRIADLLEQLTPQAGGGTNA